MEEPKKIMTPEEFAEKMKKIFKGNDIEEEHFEADELMLELLEDLGYEDGVRVFVEAKKWYA